MRTITLTLTALALLFGGAQSLFAQESILKAGQSFTLKVSGVPAEDMASLSGIYSVGQSGTIRLQYLEPVRAVGLRPSELAAKIEKAYKTAQIYTKPTINIALAQDTKSAQMVTVNGEVKAPRGVPYNVGMKMLDAIAQCSGFTDFADKKKVILVREGKRSEHDLRTAGGKSDAVLKPGDQIVVKQRKFGF